MKLSVVFLLALVASSCLAWDFEDEEDSTPSPRASSPSSEDDDSEDDLGEERDSGRKNNDDSSDGSEEKEESGFLLLHEPVFWLTEQNFTKAVINSKENWIVVFYAPWCGHTKKFGKIWRDSARSLKRQVNAGALDCDKAAALCHHYGVDRYPTVIRFSSKHKAAPTLYEGPRTVKDICKFARAKIADAMVHAVTNQMFRRFLKDYPKFPKVLLFNDAKDTPKYYKQLSSQFKERLMFGEVKKKDSEVCGFFGVDKFPKIVFTKDMDSAHAMYSGKLEKQAIAEWLSMYLPDNRKQERKKKKANESREEEEQGHSPAPPFEKKKSRSRISKIPQLTKDTYRSACANKGGVCAIAFLSPADAEGTNLAMDTLVALSNKFRGDPLAVSWVDADSNARALRDFGLESHELPVLVALKPKRLRYTVMGACGSEFATKKASSFLDKVLGGDAAFQALPAQPALV